LKLMESLILILVFSSLVPPLRPHHPKGGVEDMGFSPRLQPLTQRGRAG
jgi:hypothetical protein